MLNAEALKRFTPDDLMGGYDAALRLANSDPCRGKRRVSPASELYKAEIPRRLRNEEGRRS